MENTEFSTFQHLSRNCRATVAQLSRIVAQLSRIVAQLSRIVAQRPKNIKNHEK
jgi:hypothetical protein